MPALRVLVIEDHPDIAQSQRLLLTAMGFTAHTCPSGSQGLRMALAWRPDVVLCDIGLPGIDGYEVARTLRQQLGLSAPLLVAITGYGSPDDRARARRAGFDAVFPKPAALDEVMDYVLRRRLAMEPDTLGTARFAARH